MERKADDENISINGRIRAYISKNLSSFITAVLVAVASSFSIFSNAQYQTLGAKFANGIGAFFAFGLITFAVSWFLRARLRRLRQVPEVPETSLGMDGFRGMASGSTSVTSDAERSHIDYSGRPGQDGEDVNVVEGRELAEQEYSISLSDLHPWVKVAAVEYWRNGHYRDAVQHAAISVNKETQAMAWSYKDGTDLMSYVFGIDPPKSGEGRRLRFRGDQKTDTWKGRMQAAQALGRACYLGLRNVAAHEETVDWPPLMAFQYLAMFSVLAQWVSECDPQGV